MANPDDLKFQEFEEATDLLLADPGASTLSMSGSSRTAPAGATGDTKLDMSDDEGQEESSELLRGEKQTSGFWTFEYYQSFFNVDTMQVLDRVKGSVMPLPGRNFIKHPPVESRFVWSLLDLRDAGVLSGHQWEPVHLPELSGELPLPLQTPVPQSDNSCSSDLPVCLAGAPGCMGFPDLEAEGGEAAEWLLLPGDSVCLWLLPLHLHPHLSVVDLTIRMAPMAPHPGRHGDLWVGPGAHLLACRP